MNSLSLGVVVASTSGALGTRHDATGPMIVDWARNRGLLARQPLLVADGEPVAAALRDLIDTGCAVVITTGGTGLAHDDSTPEMTARIIDREVPGIAEAIRSRGLAKTPRAALSRGVAGIAGDTLVVNLAGSPGAVRDGLAVLDDVLDHVLAQLGHSPDDTNEVHT